MLRSHFGYERQSERRDEEFGHCKEEVEHEENPRTSLECRCLVGGKSLEGIGRRITLDRAEDGEEHVGYTCQPHTYGDLSGSGDLFASAGKASEEPHHDRSEDDYIEGVERLPYLGLDRVGLDEVTCEQRE